MKNKFRYFLAAVLAVSAISAVSCSNDRQKASDELPDTVYEEVTDAVEPHVEQTMSADADAVPVSGATPVFSASSVYGSAGSEVEVTVSLKGADKKWAMCGVHVTFDERLTCLAKADDPKTPQFKRGDALNDISGFVTMLQVGDDRNEYLKQQKKDAVFFAAVDSENKGGDGEIVTYTFKIPDDAAIGTVYDIGFYYREGDMFYDAEKDPAMQEYAFSHWQGGTVTVG